MTGTAEKGSVTVSDNGRGGFEKGGPNTLGSDLMEAYASQLGGAMHIEDIPGKGVTVCLTFPAKPNEAEEAADEADQA